MRKDEGSGVMYVWTKGGELGGNGRKNVVTRAKGRWSEAIGVKMRRWALGVNGRGGGALRCEWMGRRVVRCEWT